MPIVDVHEDLDVEIHRVWGRICDVERYPSMMTPVRSVEILERRDNSLLTSWSVLLKGSVLQWTEWEHRRPEIFRIDYEQVDGDLDVFEGHWQLEASESGGTTAVLHVQFDIGIPMLREMLDPVAVRALRENAQIMLRSLQFEDEEGAP